MIELLKEWLIESGLFKYLNETKKQKDIKFIRERYPKFQNDLFANFSMKKPLNNENVNIKNVIENRILSEYKADTIPEIKEIENCFLPMTKVYSVLIHAQGVKKIKKEDTVIDLFYEKLNFREPFDLNINISNPILKTYIPKSNEMSDEEKFNTIIEILSNNPNLEENFLFLLTGEIGSGKTTFLSKKLYELNSLKSNIFSKVAVRIDFEEFALKLLTESKKTNKLIDEYIDENIIKLVNAEISFIVNKMGLADKKKIFIALFVDNLDIIYQKFCESYFIQSNGFTFIEIFKKLVEKLKIFSYEGNNLVIIFALREESIEAIKIRKTGESSFFNEYFSMHIKIQEPSADKIKKIIKKRLDLMKKLISSQPNINKLWIEKVDRNIQLFNETKIDFDDIHNISTEGLRNTLDLFYRISTSVYCETLFKRFFIESYYIRKMHFLGDSFNYSQVNKGIFNIFLNNRLYREALCSSEHHEIYQYKTQEVKQMASINHFHTYWLKYFILLYLYHDKKEHLTREPSLKQLIAFFTPRGASNKYEENLVRLILLGLSEVTHGRLLGIKLKDNDEIDTFYLTDRAIYLLEKVVWSFSYLSIVIEDIWLQLPNILTKKCPYMFQQLDRHCSEINKEKFERIRIDNFKLQIKRVWLFIKILEISYQYEKKRVRNVFENLNNKNKELENGEEKSLFLLPNFHQIRINIKQEIIQRANEIKINDINDNYFKQLKYSETYQNDDIEKELEEFFRENYCVRDDRDELVLAQYFSDNEKAFEDKMAF